MTPYQRMGAVYAATKLEDPTGRLGDLLWLTGVKAGLTPSERADLMERVWRDWQITRGGRHGR